MFPEATLGAPSAWSPLGATARERSDAFRRWNGTTSGAEENTGGATRKLYKIGNLR